MNCCEYDDCEPLVIGPQGQPGPQGETNRGPQGPAGPQGVPSEEIGPQGPNGFQGPQTVGPQGFEGNQGVAGGNQQGSQGFSGLPGSNTVVGTQGLDGAQGPQGSFGVGIQGYQGFLPTNLIGFRGPQGNQPPPNIGAQGRIGLAQDLALKIFKNFEIDVYDRTAHTTETIDNTGPRIKIFNLPNSTQFITVGFEVTLLSNVDDVHIGFGFNLTDPPIPTTQRTLTYNGGVIQTVVYQFFINTPNPLATPELFIHFWTTSSNVPFRIQAFNNTLLFFACANVNKKNTQTPFLWETHKKKQKKNKRKNVMSDIDSECDLECDTDCDCCSAPVGPQGVVGFQGFDEVGPQGFQGFQYPTMYNYGFQGFQGIVGDVVAGPVGNTGSDGPLTSGAQGFRGTQGLSQYGPQGPVGNQGTQGFDGGFAIGVQGTQAQAGTQGLVGLRGPQGLTADGPQGPFGPAVFPTKLPFTLTGFQGNVGTQGALISDYVFTPGQYYEYMTVSITATTAANGYVKGELFTRPFVIGSQGGTFVTSSLYGEYQPSVSGHRAWNIVTDAPVAIRWTRTIYYSI